MDPNVSHMHLFQYSYAMFSDLLIESISKYLCFFLASKASPIEPTDYNDRQQHFARFKRQVTNASSNGVPAEIKEAWAKAVASKSKAAKGALFAKWLEGGGNFGSFLDHTCD